MSNYLTFSSPSSFTLKVTDNTKHWDGTLEYSTNLSAWSEWDGTTTLSADNGKLYMRGTGNTYITGSNALDDKGRSKAVWVLAGSDISCSGNIEHLLDYATVANGGHPAMANYCYYYMFRNCTSLTKAPTLPATTLASYCYSNMFYGCTSLTKAPTLPATTLVSYCYAGMFNGCTGLTKAPTLPITTLAEGCYSGMFYNCKSLTTASELPATTLTSQCYYRMFYGCTGLTKAPELPATTLANSCYRDMFNGCTSLTAAPELPAITLANFCYQDMFYNCKSLTTAPELPATTLANYCYSGMFYNCKSLTTAPELPATTLTERCYAGMFNGCTGLTKAPELPAMTLAYYCYPAMFCKCTSLTTAPELPATTLAGGCYNNMLEGCTGLTTAPTLPATTLVSYCYAGMFYGCTGLTKAPTLPATTLVEACYSNMFYGCTSLTTAPELPATTLANSCYSGMFNGCTSIKLSTAQSEEYPTPYRIPTSGTGTTATSALNSMFGETSGTFTGTPSINTTYYLHTSNEIATEEEPETPKTNISGKWELNNVQLGIESDSALAQTVNFTSNGIAFDRMILLGDYTSALTYSNQSDSYSVYTNSNGWVNQNYRLVDFGETEQEVSAEWYAGFIKNATEFVNELYSIELSTLTGIGDAIRKTTGKTDKIPVTSLATEIESIKDDVVEYDGTVVIE